MAQTQIFVPFFAMMGLTLDVTSLRPKASRYRCSERSIWNLSPSVAMMV